METTDYILAIDSGGAGVRAFVFDRMGSIVVREYQPTPASHPEEGATEYDPEELWQAVLAVARRALTGHGKTVDPAKVRAIGLTNQRASFCLWERSSGRPLTPVISWQDVRAASTTDVMNHNARWRMLKAGATFVRGLTHDPMMTATSMLTFTTDHASCRLKWALDRDPILKGMCDRGEAMFGTLDSWFIYKLTGGKRHVTDPSNASSTSLYDPFGLRWNKLFFNLFDIPLSIFPEVLDSDGDFGSTDPAFFDGVEIPIRASIGDQMAALFGHCCFEAGDVKISQGSGAFVDMNVGARGKVSHRGLFPLVGWVVEGRPTYMLEGFVATAGTLIDWLGQGLGLSDTPTVLNEFAAQCSDTEGVVFLPTPTGIRFPYFNPRVKGSIIGLSLSTHRRHVARAVFEGIALRMIDIVRGMEKDTRISIKSIRTDGGVSRSDILLQCLADFADLPVYRAPESDMTATGAAYLAGLAVGFWEDFTELKKLAKDYDTFLPLMPEEKRRKKFELWHRAVRSILAVYPPEPAVPGRRSRKVQRPT